MDAPRAEGRHQTPLPTRVNRACQRCRRNKSRCDSYRPCSLCTRANAVCLPETGSIFDRHARNVEIVTPSANSAKTFTANVAGTKRRAADLENDTNSWPAAPTSLSQAYRSSSSSNHRADWESRHAQVDYGEAESTMGIARKLYGLDRQRLDDIAVDAIPGAEVSGQTPSTTSLATQKQPIESYLTYGLPPKAVMIFLLEEYFQSVHWFSVVIYEPKFRDDLRCIQDGFGEPRMKPFLVTLSVVLGLAAWYRSHKEGSHHQDSDISWIDWSTKLIKNAELELVELMDQTSIPAIQTLTLLGTFYVYHGRPNLSFSLLGASVRISQALGLHRKLRRISFHDGEERKRVWWTIYTWDRFAAITYGRPVGINDEDCDISMPLDVLESPNFREITNAGNDDRICFSTYQRELNKLYMVASPVIKTIYGHRIGCKEKDTERDTYVRLVQEVTSALWVWRRALPSHLVLDLSQDCSLDMNSMEKAYYLQSLALQLTFDNLLIILHRPFLAQQIDTLREHDGTSSANSGNDATSRPGTPGLRGTLQFSSPQQWWDAAVRTSKVTQLPHLAQIATDSHLVAFLAINMFNAAIVMVVMALVDPLSDKAQEVKRTISRVLRLQEIFGRRSKISTQSSFVLKNVIQLLLRREAEAILTPAVRPSVSHESGIQSASQSIPSMSIEETLNLPPLHPLTSENQFAYQENSRHYTAQPSFNESLASVQRVFSNGLDASNLYNPTTSDQSCSTDLYPPTMTTDGISASNGEAATTFAPDLDPDGSLQPYNGFADSNNGVYWFWDTVWDDDSVYGGNGT